MNRENDFSFEFSLLDQVPFGVCIVEKGYTVVFWNRILEEWTGIPHADICGTPLVERFTHLAENRYLKRLLSVLEGGPPVIFSPQLHPHFIPAPLPGERLRVQQTIVSSIPPRQQSVDRRLLITITDMTQPVEQLLEISSLREQALSELAERKRAEKNLRASEKRFQDIALSSADWIWEMDQQCNYTFATEKAKDILGFDPEELKGFNFLDLLTSQEKLRALDTFMHAVARRQPWIDIEAWLLTKDGRQICLLFNAVPLFDDNGTLLGYRGVAKEITDRKNAEADREKLIKELQEALKSIKTLRGLLPICASCKKIRDDKGYWNGLETYIHQHTEAEFTHGICPECMRKLYPEMFEKT
jgi:PAS domain S-box-containing protein